MRSFSRSHQRTIGKVLVITVLLPLFIFWLFMSQLGNILIGRVRIDVHNATSHSIERLCISALIDGSQERTIFTVEQIPPSERVRIPVWAHEVIVLGADYVHQINSDCSVVTSYIATRGEILVLSLNANCSVDGVSE